MIKFETSFEILLRSFMVPLAKLISCKNDLIYDPFYVIPAFHVNININNFYYISDCKQGFDLDKNK